MSPPPTEGAAQQEIPDAVVSERKGFSVVWVIPIVAAVIGVWLTVTTILEKGPKITVTFETAEGLEGGKTKIKYRDVEIGQVDTVAIGEDRSHIVVTASIENHAKQYLTDDARLWVVKPRLDASGISGLSTLVSGAYIEIAPGFGKSQRAFKGLETPPVLKADTPGGQYVLVTETLGSLGPHSPIYYRGIRVGEVLGHELEEDSRHLRIHAFVKSPFNKLVREDTRFWNVSGLTVEAGADGVKIRTQSLQALLAGGIAFESLTSGSSSPEAQDKSFFQLFDTRTDVKESQITERIPYLLHFDGSVRGLSVDAPVEFRGIRVGSVRDVEFQLDFKKKGVRIAVVIEIEPQRFVSTMDTDNQPEKYSMMRALVERGLRAQLLTGNLLSGQQLIDLDIHPDQPNRKLVMIGKYPEIPTIPSTVSEITNSATRFLGKLEKLPLDVLVKDMRTMMETASSTLRETKQLVASIEGEAAPLLISLRQVSDDVKGTILGAEKTLASIDGLIGDNSDIRQQVTAMLLELTDASRSIKDLAEYLERHPEALVRGKSGAAN